MSPPRDQNSNGSRVDDAPAPSLRQLKEILSSGSANPEGTSGNRGGAAPGSFGSATPGRPTGERSDTGAESPDRVLTADELLTLVTPDATTNDTEVTSRALAPVSSAPARSLRAPVAFDDPVVVRPRRLGDRRARRRTGVAPFVRPSQRRSRRQRRRDYRKLGFIELTQEKARLRHRVLPRTVLGVSSMMLALGVGAAFAGASLYAYYDYRLTENETRVDEFAKGFENNFASAISEVQKARDGALQSIGASATLLQDWVDASNAVVELPQRVGGGVFLVRTLDPAGKSVLGSAFVVSSSENESLLLTSYQLVAAATAQPGPQVSIQHGQDQMTAAVWTWDPQLDLALLKVDRGGLPSLQWASDAERAEV
ncbi:MAG: hypothetical protein OEY23_15655, partial [Acidimicrobiia bacterium]|nr:hypothetical protein [Acidimicrobiia bacterium]